MWKLNYMTGITVAFLVIFFSQRGESQEQQQAQSNVQNQRGLNGITNLFTGGQVSGGIPGRGMPNWMQIANQFMSSWSGGLEQRRAANNGTIPQGGFFDSLMDGIMDVSNNIAARVQNTTRDVSPRFQNLQNRTRTWMDTWRTTWNTFF